MEGVKANLKKCSFAVDKVEVLRYILLQRMKLKNVEQDDRIGYDRVQVVRKELRLFLIIFSFYRRFIKNYENFNATSHLLPAQKYIISEVRK